MLDLDELVKAGQKIIDEIKGLEQRIVQQEKVIDHLLGIGGPLQEAAVSYVRDGYSISVHIKKVE